MKTKSLNFFIVLMTLAILFSGCEKEEKDGKVYLRINYAGLQSLTMYDDNNSGIPYDFSLGQYYECDPGVYHYEWEGKNLYGVVWCDGASYHLSAKKGGDRYYTLTLNKPTDYCGKTTID